VSRDFTFRDGERVIRFGPGVMGEALGLIEAQGLNAGRVSVADLRSLVRSAL